MNGSGKNLDKSLKLSVPHSPKLPRDRLGVVRVISVLFYFYFLALDEMDMYHPSFDLFEPVS